MGIDFPTALGIAAAAVLCIFAAALAYDPGGTADPAPLKDPSVKDGEMLLALYETAEMYRNGGQDAKAGEQEEMFHQKLAEVAHGLLGVEISSTFVDYFISGPLDLEGQSGQICGSAGDIPVHLAQVSQSDPRGVYRLTLSSTESGVIEAIWDAPGNTPADYRISWAKTGESFRTWTDLTGNAFPTGTSHTISGLEEGEEYTVKVRARYDGTAGDWSDGVTVTVAGTG